MLIPFQKDKPRHGSHRPASPLRFFFHNNRSPPSPHTNTERFHFSLTFTVHAGLVSFPIPIPDSNFISNKAHETTQSGVTFNDVSVMIERGWGGGGGTKRAGNAAMRVMVE